MSRICDGTGANQPCPRRNECEGDCHFNTAENQVVSWEGIQTHLIWATWAFVAVILFTLVGAVSYIIGRLL
jgi:hypothetical protein